MTGYHSQMIAELRTAVENGDLTCSEIDGRLADEINKEINKTNEAADLDFIKSCHALLRELHGNEMEPSEELMRRSLESARAKLHSRKKRSPMHVRTAIRATAIAAALIIAVVVGDQVLRREWLDGASSDDEQKFAVSGHIIDPGLVESGKAGTSTKEQEITTTELSEAIGVLGYIPQMPTWFPDDWEIEEYYAQSIEAYQLLIMIVSSDSVDEVVQYQATRYASIEDAQASFEQNEHGQSISCNGWDVYFTQNMEKSMAVWWEGDTCHALYGPLPQSDLTKIIESIQKGVP